MNERSLKNNGLGPLMYMTRKKYINTFCTVLEISLTSHNAIHHNTALLQNAAGVQDQQLSLETVIRKTKQKTRNEPFLSRFIVV